MICLKMKIIFKKIIIFLNMNKSLLDYYKFYSSYHQNIINKLIHYICIPGIAWSGLGLINNNYYLKKYKIPELIYLMYAILYLRYSLVVGTLANLFYGYLLLNVKKKK